MLLQTRFIEDKNLVIPTGRSIPKYIDRSWKERLFSKPWKPFKKEKLIFIPEYAPDRNIYKLNDDTFVIHPILAQEIRTAIRDGYEDAMKDLFYG